MISIVTNHWKKKSILSIKIEAPKTVEKREGQEESKRSMGGMGVVLLSKKKTKDWLNVPVRAKPKAPLFPEKEAEHEQPTPVVETEEEEMDTRLPLAQRIGKKEKKNHNEKVSKWKSDAPLGEGFPDMLSYSLVLIEHNSSKMMGALF